MEEVTKDSREVTISLEEYRTLVAENARLEVMKDESSNKYYAEWRLRTSLEDRVKDMTEIIGNLKERIESLTSKEITIIGD